MLFLSLPQSLLAGSTLRFAGDSLTLPRGRRYTLHRELAPEAPGHVDFGVVGLP